MERRRWLHGCTLWSPSALHQQRQHKGLATGLRLRRRHRTSTASSTA
jgi:hypothetical protein